MATVEDICRLTGKSRATVSRVLRNDQQYRVRPAVRQQVLKAAAQVGYEPNHLARSLATGKSFCIGVVQGQAEKSFGSPFFAPTLLEMANVALERGYHLALLPVEVGEVGESQVLKAIHRRRIDGFYLSTRIFGQQTLDELIRRKIPAVTTDPPTELGASDKLSVVLRDDRSGYVQLAQELRRRGHRQVGYVTGGYLTRDPVRGNRLAVFRQAMAEQDIEVPEHRVLCYEPRTDGAIAEISEACRAMRANMDRFAGCTVMVGASDAVAFGVADALRERGIEPGRDVALAGFDDLESSPNFPTREPFLTTIDPQRRLRGRKVAELLVEAMENPAFEPTTFAVPTKLIVRRSMIDASACCWKPSH
ncbi:LacI family DNA-binding transcriptional regulator [Phycisphaerales bacterium AB-hyl4]|uniref:LacI family DNA-binding transcriptional regulator n=1 Tax=Natronomicrosphaera hydrolytica TaxID=3242702 RepID=A0ABV4U954_9BACT